ncbi:MAG: DUF2961 domain-containing protein [Phycisphaerae bacterium]
MKRIVCLTLFLMATLHAAGEISLGSLLNDMTDRSKIAEFSSSSFTCSQASSYDRASKTPGNADWFANDDWSNFIRTEETAGRREWVLMDVDGPGAVVRWWITGFNYNGVLRVYLDGSDEPVISGRAAELIGGDALLGPPLSEETSRGRNLYLPIPYQKHCKITYDGPNARETKDFADNLYYNINYLTYAEGTTVETFTMDGFRANAALIKATQKKLLEPKASQCAVEKSIDGVKAQLAGGESQSIEIGGPAAISCLKIRISAEDMPQAMRSTIIRAEFDGEETVWAPVGEFFGTGNGLNPFKGWWREAGADGWMSCYWPMPFREKARVSFVNYGNAPIRLETGQTDIAKWQWTPRTMYFHCLWRGEAGIDMPGPDKNRIEEWSFASIEGRGWYAGDTLALFNRSDAWWGEGDEKVFVDGEAFPSHFGTGTEDYYGYAWASADYFTSPFHAQPNGSGNNSTDFVTNTRVRLLDVIPFEESLRFNMELHHWQETRIDYATTAYYYAFAGATDNAIKDRGKVAEKVGIVWQLTEGENMQLRKVSGGFTENQKGDWGASNGTHLLWKYAAVGDELEVAFKVNKSGLYDVSMRVLTAVDYGRFKIYLDGIELFKEIDFYIPNGVKPKTLPVGRHRLDEGEHRLMFVILEPNPDARQGNLAGLDCIELEAVR